MMQRYTGKDAWSNPSGANTLFGGTDALPDAPGSADQQQGIQPTQLTWTQITAAKLGAELSQLHGQHVVYLRGAMAVSEWTDALRESVAGFGACARTEFNINDDMFEGLLRS